MQVLSFENWTTIVLDGGRRKPTKNIMFNNDENTITFFMIENANEKKVTINTPSQQQDLMKRTLRAYSKDMYIKTTLCSDWFHLKKEDILNLDQ